MSTFLWKCDKIPKPINQHARETYFHIKYPSVQDVRDYKSLVMTCHLASSAAPAKMNKTYEAGLRLQRAEVNRIK